MGTGGGFDNNEKHLSPVTSSRTNMETVIAAGQTGVRQTVTTIISFDPGI